MKSVLLLTLFAIFTFSTTYAKTAEEWKTRVIYQMLTDRFATSSGDSAPCTDLNNYCGGTFNGIRQNLDYIQGMGFNAIWISPIIANTERGYHGYWAKNLYEINENFGTEEEFHELVNECHSRDIWVMVDVVANHMGYFTEWNYGSLFPFNDVSHYNTFVDCGPFEPADPAQFDHVERCWLAGLPDLNQTNPFVRSTLLKWVKDFVQNYQLDGIRIDTIPHVRKDFWAEFSKEAGVYTIGEVLSFNMKYIATYQGAVDGVLNYGLYTILRDTFGSGRSMNGIEQYYNDAGNTWADITVLGNFVDNHDNPRFLSSNDNIIGFKAALAFSVTSVGIPIVYYGDEQAFTGGQDPQNREALWTNMNRESDIYKFITTINNFRQKTRFFDHHQVQRFSDDSFYAFSRGEFFFAFTNSQDYQSRSITYHPYSDGTVLCNIFYENDCVTVQNGAFPVILLNGEVKIFVPAKGEEQRGDPRTSIPDRLRIAAMNAAYEVTSL